MYEMEHTSATEDEKDACPLGVGDATVHKDGTASWGGPELVLTYELKFE